MRRGRETSTVNRPCTIFSFLFLLADSRQLTCGRYTVCVSQSQREPMEGSEPIYIDGMLAVCSHCGISSIDFNRCIRCKRKLPKDVKSIPMAMGRQEKKETMLPVDTCGRGSGRGVSRSRPIHKEPECLTISSDEEEEGNSRKSEGSNNSSFFYNANSIFTDEMKTTLEKGVVIRNNYVPHPRSDYAMESEESSIESLRASVLCRTIRIGSHKYVPREGVIISQTGVRFNVPLLEDVKSFVSLEVKFQDIVNVLIHFGKAMPVLFFYTSADAGVMIRQRLGMRDPKGPYYDPAGKDETHRRITLLPVKLTGESKVVLKNLFSRENLLVELNSTEANDILIRASPKNVRSMIQG